MLTMSHMRQGASALLRLILSFYCIEKGVAAFYSKRRSVYDWTPAGHRLRRLLRRRSFDFSLSLVFVLATRSSGMFGLHPTDAMTNLTTLDSCLLLNAAQGCVNGSRFDALHGGLFNLLGKNTSLLHT